MRRRATNLFVEKPLALSEHSQPELTNIIIPFMNRLASPLTRCPPGARLPPDPWLASRPLCPGWRTWSPSWRPPPSSAASPRCRAPPPSLRPRPGSWTLSASCSPLGKMTMIYSGHHICSPLTSRCDIRLLRGAAPPRFSELIFVFLCVAQLGHHNRCQLGLCKS